MLDTNNYKRNIDKKSQYDYPLDISVLSLVISDAEIFNTYFFRSLKISH